MVTDNYCGIENEDLLIENVNHPIDGRMPVSAQAIEEKSGYRVTAVATEVINRDTVAFFGTSNGNLRKVSEAEGDVIWIICLNLIARNVILITVK